MSDEAIRRQVNQIQVFAEVEPNQKERIIVALRQAGNVVGFMGDGINDASALHAALCRWTAPWTWPRRRRISFYWKKICRSWFRGCRKAG